LTIHALGLFIGGLFIKALDIADSYYTNRISYDQAIELLSLAFSDLNNKIDNLFPNWNTLLKECIELDQDKRSGFIHCFEECRDYYYENGQRINYNLNHILDKQRPTPNKHITNFNLDALLNSKPTTCSSESLTNTEINKHLYDPDTDIRLLTSYYLATNRYVDATIGKEEYNEWLACFDLEVRLQQKHLQINEAEKLNEYNRPNNLKIKFPGTIDQLVLFVKRIEEEVKYKIPTQVVESCFLVQGQAISKGGFPTANEDASTDSDICSMKINYPNKMDNLVRFIMQEQKTLRIKIKPSQVADCFLIQGKLINEGSLRNAYSAYYKDHTKIIDNHKSPN